MREYFEQAIEMLKTHEGFRGDVYYDTEGFATVGYGFKLPLRPGPAEAALRAYVHESEDDVRRLYPEFDELTDSRRAVLLDMAYNLGTSGLAGFAKMRAAVREGDWSRAAAEMLDSRWAKQVGGRALRLAEMMKRG